MATVPTPSTAGQVTGRPWITLVDIDGFGVPDAERWTPTMPPDPAEQTAESWGAWADAYRFELGPGDDDDDFARPTAEDGHEPSAEDWKDYSEWSAELDARREEEERVEEMRDWYRWNSIEDFNRQRTD